MNTGFSRTGLNIARNILTRSTFSRDGLKSLPKRGGGHDAHDHGHSQALGEVIQLL